MVGVNLVLVVTNYGTSVAGSRGCAITGRRFQVRTSTEAEILGHQARRQTKGRYRGLIWVPELGAGQREGRGECCLPGSVALCLTTSQATVSPIHSCGVGSTLGINRWDIYNYTRPRGYHITWFYNQVVKDRRTVIAEVSHHQHTSLGPSHQ
jgi:hypothetical protein